MGNIQRGYFSLGKLEFLTKETQVDNNDLVHYGDFLFNTRNTLELVGKGATWMKEEGVFAFNSNIAVFQFEGINTIFFNYLYNTSSMMAQIRARATGTTSVAAVYPRSLRNISYHLPRISEQSKIGSLFKTLDGTIALHQHKIALLKQLKKGLLQKMFADKKQQQPTLRFNSFVGEWEQRKLGDALEEFSYGLNTPATEFDGKNKYLRITDIDDDTHAFNQTSLTSPKDKDDNYILGQGDILFARTGASVGKTYMYKANDGKVYYAGFLIKGHIKNGFSTEFIFDPKFQE